MSLLRLLSPVSQHFLGVKQRVLGVVKAQHACCATCRRPGSSSQHPFSVPFLGPPVKSHHGQQAPCVNYHPFRGAPLQPAALLALVSCWFSCRSLRSRTSQNVTSTTHKEGRCTGSWSCVEAGGLEPDNSFVHHVHSCLGPSSMRAISWPASSSVPLVKAAPALLFPNTRGASRRGLDAVCRRAMHLSQALRAGLACMSLASLAAAHQTGLRNHA